MVQAPNQPCEVCALIGVHTPTPLGEKLCPECQANVRWARGELRKEVPGYEKALEPLHEDFQDHLQECIEKVRRQPPD